MKNYKELPNRIPIFPLSNFIIFPETTVPLNIFEPRYIEMINDCMKNSKIIGLIQPRKTVNNSIPDLYNIGCAGKIKNINETQDGRYLVMLHGISRFKILKEIKTDKLYRECEVNYNFYNHDLEKNDFKIETSELNSIFKDVKLLFKKQGYSIDWKAIEKQNTNQTINALSMASPFSLEEKQILLESINLETRKIKLEQILKNYTLDSFSNNTIQ
jgi:uncharacterized protein